MSNPNLTYRQFILNELSGRQSRNRQYSMGAFARDLGISGSRLSEILNGKVGLSQSRALDFAQKLGLSEKEKVYFLDLVLAEHARSPLVRAMSKDRVNTISTDFHQVSEDQIKFISDYLPSAILEALNLKSIQKTPEGLAKFLGASLENVTETLEQLERMEAVIKKETWWEPTHKQRTTTANIPSKTIRDHHVNILTKAQEALHTQEVTNRDFSSCIFGLNKNQLTYAKERINKFRRELMQELELDHDKNAVYCLSMQLFEVSKSEEFSEEK